MSLRNVQFAVATHIMVVLGYGSGEEVSSRLLAESVNANPTFVRKSLSKLAKAGLVVTRRGKAGASALARPAARITLLDIYRASGSPAAFVTHSYPVESECIVSRNFKICMSGVLSEVQSGLEQSLSKNTLSKANPQSSKKPSPRIVLETSDLLLPYLDSFVELWSAPIIATLELLEVFDLTKSDPLNSVR